MAAEQLNIFTQYGLEISRPKAQFIDPSMRKPKTDIYRIDGKGFRYYYNFVGGEPVFYRGVTSIISNTRRRGRGLDIILVERGWDSFYSFLRERGHYGTWMHMNWNQYLIEGSISTAEADLDESLRAYSEKYRFAGYADGKKAEKFILDMSHDLNAFRAWVDDHRVKPLLIEQPLVHKDGYAGCLDLLCELTVEEKGYWGEVYKSGPRQGQEKESKKAVNVIAVVDYKSGRSGFFDDYEIQLDFYRNLVNENYPDIKVDRLYDLSPKKPDPGHKSPPGYNFSDQTNTLAQGESKYLLEIIKIYDKYNKPGDMFQYNSKLEIGEMAPESARYITIEEVVKQIREEKKL